MTAVTLYAVFADMAEADRIGRQMVEEGLAACVNILQPCRSIYRWEGAIETASEVQALFKTTMDGADRLIERRKNAFLDEQLNDVARRHAQRFGKFANRRALGQTHRFEFTGRAAADLILKFFD